MGAMKGKAAQQPAAFCVGIRAFPFPTDFNLTLPDSS